MKRSRLRCCCSVRPEGFTEIPLRRSLSGDELEVDFRNGFFINHTRDIRREYPPIPDTLLEVVQLGGNAGWLKHWHETQGAGA